MATAYLVLVAILILSPIIGSIYSNYKQKRLDLEKDVLHLQSRYPDAFKIRHPNFVLTESYLKRLSNNHLNEFLQEKDWLEATQNCINTQKEKDKLQQLRQNYPNGFTKYLIQYPKNKPWQIIRDEPQIISLESSYQEKQAFKHYIASQKELLDDNLRIEEPLSRDFNSKHRKLTSISLRHTINDGIGHNEEFSVSFPYWKHYSYCKDSSLDYTYFETYRSNAALLHELADSTDETRFHKLACKVYEIIKGQDIDRIFIYDSDVSKDDFTKKILVLFRDHRLYNEFCKLWSSTNLQICLSDELPDGYDFEWLFIVELETCSSKILSQAERIIHKYKNNIPALSFISLFHEIPSSIMAKWIEETKKEEEAKEEAKRKEEYKRKYDALLDECGEGVKIYIRRIGFISKYDIVDHEEEIRQFQEEWEIEQKYNALKTKFPDGVRIFEERTNNHDIGFVLEHEAEVNECEQYQKEIGPFESWAKNQQSVSSSISSGHLPPALSCSFINHTIAVPVEIQTKHGVPRIHYGPELWEARANIGIRSNTASSLIDFPIIHIFRESYCKNAYLNQDIYPALKKNYEIVLGAKKLRTLFPQGFFEDIISFIKSLGEGVCVLLDDSHKDYDMLDKNVIMRIRSILKQDGVRFEELSLIKEGTLSNITKLVVLDAIGEKGKCELNCINVCSKVQEIKPLIVYVSVYRELSLEEANDIACQEKQKQLSDVSHKKKENSSDILQYLNDNNVHFFYHFTDRRNLESIKRCGGLYSWKYCKDTLVSGKNS